MNDTVRLLLLSFVPLLAGYLLNYALLFLPFSLFFLSIVLLLLWMYFCHKKATPERNPFWQALLLNTVGLVMLLLVFIQEYAMGYYWANIIGLLSQVCFLPCLPLVGVFMSGRLGPIFAVAWLLMFAASAIGCVMKKRISQ